VAAAALEGGGTTCARPASFPSAVANSVHQQLSGPIPVEVPSQLKISFDKKSLNGKVRDMTMLLFCVNGKVVASESNFNCSLIKIAYSYYFDR
jgi:hypothetical protein